MWGRGKRQLQILQEEVQRLERQALDATKFVEKLSNGDFAEIIGEQNDRGALHEALLKFRDKFDSLSKLEKQQNWVNTGLAKFVEILRIENKSEEELYRQIISSLVKYVDANQGGIFILNQTQELELKACYAYERQKFVQGNIRIGDGLLGQCFLEGETTLLTQVPNKYTHITSGLGEATPNVLLLVPLKTDKKVVGVLEIAGFHVFEAYEIAFVEKLAENIAAVVIQANTSLEMRKLLQQTQQNQERMQMQEEEMRQSMEELSATQEELVRREEDTKRQLEALRKDYQKQLVEIQDRETELKKQKDLLVKALSVDNILIDVAGRNRMLSQKICFLCELVMSGRMEYQVQLKAAIGLHDASIMAIKEGGLPPSIKTTHEFAKASDFIMPNIEKVLAAWIPFKDAALKICEAKTEQLDKLKEALTYVENNGLQLLDINNELVLRCIEFNQKKLMESGLMKL